MIRQKNNLIAILLLLVATTSHAQDLRKLYAKDLLIQSAKHLPTIMRSRAAIEQQKGSLQTAYGALDRRVDGNVDSRLSGYYDGKSAKLTAVQPFADYNGSVYGGYRVSDGLYPSYDGEYNTENNGEVAVGAIFSLLRGRDIDPRRTQINNEELKLREAKFALEIEQLNSQLNALLAYWEWQSKGLEYQIRKDIWQIANKRQAALTKEVKAGNKARIFLVENRQNMLKRKSALRDVERLLNNAAQGVSFFYRDDEGKIIVPQNSQLPVDFELALGQIDVLKNADQAAHAASQLLARRPDIQRLKLAIARAQADEKLARNNLLPMLDMQTEISKDLGQAQNISNPLESKLKLNLSIPLQTRDARGKIAQAKALQRILEHDGAIIEQQLEIELQRIYNDIKIGEELMQITAEERQIAAKLLAAEKRRFADGASDFFLLNIREETLAESQIRHVLAMQRYYVAISRLLATTMQTDLLAI